MEIVSAESFSRSDDGAAAVVAAERISPNLPSSTMPGNGVATVAAYGYTDGQIAHKICIAVIVEQHLTCVYRTLEVASRTELPVDILLCNMNITSRVFVCD